MRKPYIIRQISSLIACVAVMAAVVMGGFAVPAYAASCTDPGVCDAPSTPSAATTGHKCGKGSKQIETSIDFGCKGDSYGGAELNAITDLGFALFRFFSIGVGLIAIISIIIAGIQYSASRGNPQATQAAIQRVSNTVIALLIYIFMYAIINFLVPGGIFT